MGIGDERVGQEAKSIKLSKKEFHYQRAIADLEKEHYESAAVDLKIAAESGSEEALDRLTQLASEEQNFYGHWQLIEYYYSKGEQSSAYTHLERALIIYANTIQDHNILKILRTYCLNDFFTNVQQKQLAIIYGCCLCGNATDEKQLKQGENKIAAGIQDIGPDFITARDPFIRNFDKYIIRVSILRVMGSIVTDEPRRQKILKEYFFELFAWLIETCNGARWNEPLNSLYSLYQPEHIINDSLVSELITIVRSMPHGAQRTTCFKLAKITGDPAAQAYYEEATSILSLFESVDAMIVLLNTFNGTNNSSGSSFQLSGTSIGFSIGQQLQVCENKATP